MTTAILDTNVVVQSLLSSPPAAAPRVLDAFYDGRFRLVYSPATIDELIEVLLVPHIRDRHGLSDDELLEFVASLLPLADRWTGGIRLPHTITRDVPATKFLALAAESRANYLVTNDRRHLLRLKQFLRTRIVSPAHFLRLTFSGSLSPPPFVLAGMPEHRMLVETEGLGGTGVLP